MGSWSRGEASLVSGLPPSLTTTAGPRELCGGAMLQGDEEREERGASRGGGWLSVPGRG